MDELVVGGVDDVELQLGAREVHEVGQGDERETGFVTGHGGDDSATRPL